MAAQKHILSAAAAAWSPEQYPEQYQAWYHTPRGAWMAQRELALLQRLSPLPAGSRLLDAGTGTGHFARRFHAAGLRVTGLDRDAAMLRHARQLALSEARPIHWVHGDLLALPFADRQFDYCSAITALCFIANPLQAIREMWRVSRRGILLGLLHRHSLLHRQKAGAASYQSARWDTALSVRRWAAQLQPPPASVRIGYALFFPRGNLFARQLETIIPTRLPLGGFLGAALYKADQLLLPDSQNHPDQT